MGNAKRSSLENIMKLHIINLFASLLLMLLISVVPDTVMAASPSFSGTLPILTTGTIPSNTYIGGVQFDVSLPSGITVSNVINNSDSGSLIAFNQSSPTSARIAIVNVNQNVTNLIIMVQCSGSFSGLLLTDFVISNAQVIDTGGNQISSVSLTSSYNPDGDLNGDGLVQSVDALLALRLAVGLDPLSANALIHGDMNGDGKITSADALLILRKAVGL